MPRGLLPDPSPRVAELTSRQRIGGILLLLGGGAASLLGLDIDSEAARVADGMLEFSRSPAARDSSRPTCGRLRPWNC